MFEPALRVDPIEHQPGEVPGEGGRRAGKRFSFGVNLVVEHAGSPRSCSAQQILAHDDHGETGDAHVLLGAGIDDAELRDIDGARQNRRGHVRHQDCAAQIRHLVELHAADGFVGGEMQKGRVLAQAPLGERRYTRVALLSAARHHVDLHEARAFLDGHFRPQTRIDVIRRRAVASEIQGHGRKLRARRAVEKQDRIVVWNRHQSPQRAPGAVGNCSKGLAAMIDFHYRHSVAAEFE